MIFFLTLYFFISVVLLDTTTEESLDWTKFPFGPNAPTPGVSYLRCNPENMDRTKMCRVNYLYFVRP